MFRRIPQLDTLSIAALALFVAYVAAVFIA
jgi:hypothetical protein